MLSNEQITHYQEHGYVIPDYRLTTEQVETIRSQHVKLLNTYPQYSDYCPALLIHDTGFLNFARNAAVGQKGTVAIFSLEMSGEQLAMRMLSSEAGVKMTRLRLGRHGEDEESRVMHAHGQLGGALVYIDDTAALTVPEIRAKARRLQADHGLDLVVVDYLQLLHGAGRTDTRANELSQITSSLKELARELNVPVIAAAQLSRAVESRNPHIPMLSDLRESGSIEQDADILMFIYREDMYTQADD